MIIVKLKGGLGNQMFQYAAAKRLAIYHNTDLKMDLSFLNNKRVSKGVTKRNYELFIFNIEAEIATWRECVVKRNLFTRLKSKIFPESENKYIKEKYFNFDPSILALSGDCYLDGHWISAKYFCDVEQIIQSHFTFKYKMLKGVKVFKDRIVNSNSICIQIRRGDYVSNPSNARLYATTSVQYFQEGIRYMQKNVDNPVFFVFSDDPTWCRSNLMLNSPVFFVESELEDLSPGNSDVLQLMQACKHFIISNSTFAWWGAWLSSNKEKIVIAPKNWFNDPKIMTSDIYLPDWVRI